MSLPTPYTVQRLPFDPGATDAHGNPVDAWGAPVDVAVHGWASPSADTVPSDPNRDAVIRDLDLYAPAGTVGRPKDHWVIPGEAAQECHHHPGLMCFAQVGYVEDYTKGPWQNPAAGVRINLKRAEG